MRILVWATFFYPHVGGYEKNVQELSKRLVAKGHRVTIVTCNTNRVQATEKLDGVTVLRIPSIGLLHGLYPIPLPSQLLYKVLRRRGRYDVVSTQTRFFSLSLIGAAYAVYHKLPLVHTERGTCHVVTSNSLLGLISRVYDHTIGSWIIRRAVWVIGVSEKACDFAGHLGACRVARVPNGVTVPSNQSVPTVLFVGRLIQAKGVQDLIAATGKLDGRCRLLIVGDGVYRSALLREANKKHNIEFLGELHGESLSNVYKSATVFVNPSYSEGLPTAVMEAAISEVPIVATDVGGTREIVHPPRTGILVEPHDIDGLANAIQWVLDNKDKANDMARNCRKHVEEKYSWDSVVDANCSLLEDACFPVETEF